MVSTEINFTVNQDSLADFLLAITQLQVFADVYRELCSAQKEHPRFNSAHEGYAVIKEEFEELWDEIKRKSKRRNMEDMRKEAIQVAAMAIRLVHDVVDKPQPEHGADGE